MADGAKVAFTYANSRDRAEAVAAATGGAAHPIRADNRHEQDIEAAVAETADRFGGLDILVNNAAVGSFGSHHRPEDGRDRRDADDRRALGDRRDPRGSRAPG
ncbi:SDR family oxidoreductase [Amycolatopsis tucumanensis]|uniref:SDR family oxidoreductase n=1 Tax=Amycolatopsis tucumanensis TaxID=401106 RepID=UPI003D725319